VHPFAFHVPDIPIDLEHPLKTPHGFLQIAQREMRQPLVPNPGGNGLRLSLGFGEAYRFFV
jgi:hypothetical protein